MKSYRTVGPAKKAPINPFRSTIHNAIHDAVTHKPDVKTGNMGSGEDTPYHKAMRVILHHIAIADLSKGNKEMEQTHRDKAFALRKRLGMVMREHPITGQQMMEARQQRVHRRNIHHHLAEIERESKGIKW